METDNNNIKTFTAADIEKYHRGLLSPKERHALEKAALDDPFLADALEGYGVPGSNPSADLADLKARLAERTGAKIVSIGSPKSSFPWLRAAIMVGVLAGASLLTYQFFFNNKTGPDELAQAPTTGKQKSEEKMISTGDSSIPVNNSAYLLSPDTLKITHGLGYFKADSSAALSSKDKASDFFGYQTTPTEAPAALYKKDSIANDFNAIVTAPAVKQKTEEREVKGNESKLQGVIPNAPTDDKFAKSRKADNVAVEKFSQKEEMADTTKSQAPLYYEALKDNEQQRAVAAYNKRLKQATTPVYYSNVFNGRVIDAGNNGLPFANVMNTRDNVGTYTDVNGRFTLTSPDSILNVQIRSTGFDNNVVQLRSNLNDNQVVMEEDRSVAAQTLQGPRRVNSERRRTLVLEGEPEPEDGWENYDSYLSNNVNIPGAFKPKQNASGGGQVELSFEVNEDGEPVKIKVEKSLCKSCDKEAIRLIKEGPRWKRKARKGRTTVTISF